jgi:Nucleotidyltransferase domain
VSLERLDPEVRAIVECAADRAIAEGAKAVLLTGSQARGSASPGSDIDLFVVGDGPAESHEIVDGHLLSVHWWTPEQARQRMSDPPSAFVSVFAWRDAEVVADPLGVGAELKQVARDWSWDALGSEADAWVADRLLALAEYVSKLARALEDGRYLDAAATRSHLALALAEVGAVVNRITSRSENGLWETIADSGDARWRELLARALAAGKEDVTTSGEAALQLFRWLASSIEPTLQPAQRAVMEYALAGRGRGVRPSP